MYTDPSTHKIEKFRGGHTSKAFSPRFASTPKDPYVDGLMWNYLYFVASVLLFHDYHVIAHVFLYLRPE